MTTTVREHTPLQKICIGMGVFFLLMGGIGIIMPGFMGLHLSMANNIVHVATGVLAIWVGYSDMKMRAYNFCVAFGTVFGLIGLAGVVLGEPGYPAVGFTRADEYLLRVIPNVLEFGTMDHIVHVGVSLILLASAFIWRKENTDIKGRTTVDVQARAGLFDIDKNKRVDPFINASDSTSTTPVNPVHIDQMRKRADEFKSEKRT